MAKPKKKAKKTVASPKTDRYVRTAKAASLQNGRKVIAKWTREINVTQNDRELTIDIGQSDFAAGPRRHVHRFANDKEAKRANDDLAQSLNAADYVAKKGKLGTARESPHHALERFAAVGESDDESAFLVHADALTEAGDPRGELIALQSALAKKPKDGKLASAITKLLTKHQSALLGPLGGANNGDDLSKDKLTLDWRLGYVDTIDVHCGADNDKTQALLDRALAHPSCGLLRRLSMDDVNDKMVGVIACAAPGTSLRELSLGSIQEAICSGCIGDPSPLWLAFPNLEDVTLHSQFFHAIGPVSLARSLKRLRLRTPNLTTVAAEAISAATLPSLERLELWIGTPNDEGPVIADLDGLFEGDGLPRLKHLGLCNFGDEIASALCSAIVGSRLVSRLESLDLSFGTLGGSDVRILIKSKSTLKHLKTLNLHCNYLSKKDCDEVRRAFPSVNVDVSLQKESTSRQFGDVSREFRFVSVFE